MPESSLSGGVDLIQMLRWIPKHCHQFPGSNMLAMVGVGGLGLVGIFYDYISS